MTDYFTTSCKFLSHNNSVSTWQARRCDFHFNWDCLNQMPVIMFVNWLNKSIKFKQNWWVMMFPLLYDYTNLWWTGLPTYRVLGCLHLQFQLTEEWYVADTYSSSQSDRQQFHALKIEAARFSEILANQPTTVWGHYQRMEMMLPTQVVITA